MKNYEYDAFGREWDAVATDNNPFRYCGEYYDKPTIGDPGRPVEPEDILRADRVLYLAGFLALGVGLAFRLGIWFGLGWWL